MRRDRRGRGFTLLAVMMGDLRRRSFRTMASALTIAAVVGALFASSLLTAGASYSTQQISDKLGADIMLLPQGAAPSSRPFYTLLYTPGPNYMTEEYVQAVLGVPGVKEATGQLYLTDFREVGGGGYATPTYYIVAVDSSNFMLRSWLAENVSRPLGQQEAILGWGFPRLSDMPNDRVFYGVRVAPVYRLPITGTFVDHVMFVSLDTAAAMHGWQDKGIDPGPSQNWMIPLSFSEGQVSAVFVKVARGVSPDDVAQRIESSFKGVRAITLNSLVGSANSRLGEFLSASSYSTVLSLAASALLVGAVTAGTTNERRREFGIMRGLGATRVFIGRLVATQTMILAGLSGMAGIILSWLLFAGLYSYVISTLGVPHQMPQGVELLAPVAYALLISVVIGAFAAIWPAFVASRGDPYEVSRGGVR